MKKIVILVIMMHLIHQFGIAKKDITAFIEKKIVGKETPGFQYIIADSSGIIFEYNGGFSNLETKQPITPVTEFKAYSSTKTFTALAIMQLVEAGKLSLDDTVGQVLNIPFSGAFTFRQVLSHTAGLTGKPLISQIHLESEHDSFDASSNTKKLIDQYTVLSFSPGKKKKYSNLGFLLLGYTISKISSMPYEDYVIKNIFSRLGQENPYGFIFTQNTAKAYLRTSSLMHFLYGLMVDKNKYYDTKLEGFQGYKNLYVNGTSYGGIFTNARGLVNYGLMLMKKNSPLLSDGYKEQLFTSQILSNGKSSGHTLGWFIKEKKGVTYYSHPGGGGGYSCEIRIYPEKGIVSVFMMNTTQLLSHLKLLDKLDQHFLSESR